MLRVALKLQLGKVLQIKTLLTASTTCLSKFRLVVTRNRLPLLVVLCEGLFVLQTCLNVLMMTYGRERSVTRPIT